MESDLQQLESDLIELE
jgi:hypothetical protein